MTQNVQGEATDKPLTSHVDLLGAAAKITRMGFKE